jgi:hypothetical protein
MYGIIGMELFFHMIVVVAIMKRQRKRKRLNQTKNRILFNIFKPFHSVYNTSHILIQPAKHFTFHIASIWELSTRALKEIFEGFTNCDANFWIEISHNYEI